MIRQAALLLVTLLLGTAARAQVPEDSVEQTAKPPTPAPPASLPAVQASAGKVLSDREYAFCHHDDYPLTGYERTFCPLVGPDNPRCAAFGKACAVYAQAKPSSCDDEEPLRRPSAPSSVSVVFRTLYYLLIFLGAGILLWFILRYAIPAGPEDEAPRERPADEPADSGPSKEERFQVETDVSRLIARARGHAQAGAYRQAIHDLHAALVRRLEGYRLIRVHPSRTNGDFLHDLEPRGDLRPEIRDIFGEVDRMEFGTTAPDASAYESLFTKVTTFVARPLAILLLLGITGSLLSCSLLKRGDAASVPSGHSALVTFLGKHGHEAFFRLKSMDNWRANAPDQLLLLANAPALPDRTYEELLDWVSEGGTLIVTDAAYVSQRLQEAVGIKSIHAAAADGSVTFPPKVFSPERTNLPSARLPQGVTLELDPAKAKRLGVTPFMVKGSQPYAVVRTFGKRGRLVVFADDDLFTNISLAVGDNGAVILHTFAEHGVKIEVISQLTGSMSQNPTQALSKAGMTAFLWHLLAWVVLFILWKGIPFGTPRDPEIANRRSFAEHVRALGLIYARAKSSRWVLAAYGTYVFDRLRERLRLGGQQGFSRMTQALAIRSGRDQGAIGRLLAETMDAKENPKMESHSPEAIATNLALMRELGDLLGTSDKPKASERKDTPS